MSDIYVPIRTIAFSVLAPALGIELARFKNRKDEWQGYCPIHGSEKNNCFSYNTGNGKWHCFSCDAKGSGSIDLTIKVKGLGFKEACAFLEPLVGKQPAEHLAKEKSPVVGDSGALQPFKGSYNKYQVKCDWLDIRIPDINVRERYGVFCYNNPARKSAYSGRVMIPIKSLEGVLYGYLGRSIHGASTSPASQTDTDTPKYLFPPNFPKSRFLFGAHELREEIHQGRHGKDAQQAKVLYLVESPFCVMKFAMYGLPAVSCYGWSVSEPQLQLLKELSKGVVYLPDLDKAQEARQVCAEIAQHLWVRFPPLPAGIDDPEYLTKEQVLAL